LPLVKGEPQLLITIAVMPAAATNSGRALRDLGDVGFSLMFVEVLEKVGESEESRMHAAGHFGCGCQFLAIP
jgi:hypothetical protein